MDFQIFHLYNRLVRRDMAEALACPTCEEVYVLREKEDKPVLQCFGCQSLVEPGLTMWNEIQAVVKEHFE